MSAILDQLRALEPKGLAALSKAKSAPELQETKSQFLGKKGELSEILKGLKDLDAASRPVVGAEANRVRDSLEKAYAARLQDLEDAEISGRLAKEGLDLSLPGRRRKLGAKHPLTQVRSHLYGIFQELGFSIASGPEVETEFCNFEALNVPADHPARDMQDTLYCSPGIVLRTQTSSVQIRAMLLQPPPIKVVAAGAVYRNDAVDATHSPMFHQMEGLYVDKGVHMGHLRGTLELFARRLMGANTKIRLRPSFFPFTEPSVEVDFSCAFCSGKGCRVCKQSGWIEILGAGMVNPRVFTQVSKAGGVNYDSSEVTGFAFGIGIERVAMLFYDINDIRLFYENDLRFLEQFRQ